VRIGASSAYVSIDGKLYRILLNELQVVKNLEKGREILSRSLKYMESAAVVKFGKIRIFSV
jgi:hypothetical protein